ncbi:hypothetical protein L1049_006628 [Liquidambar formosana]|uniref:CG-1 domain-containing protein n=1 Tax=Liquidambar formosana TaxID=63359 RepID=A0AAP0WRM6_LIQFO
MTQSGFNINDLVKEAQTRWLKPAEVLFILQNHREHQLTQQPPQKPNSGSLFLFNKRVLRFFRRDGHSWRKKKDGRTVGEAHERLKVGNAEALNCYYAHGEQNPNFQRRSYWMLDPLYEHIVLVHYRDITEGRHSSGSISLLSPGSSSTLCQSPGSDTTQNRGSTSVINENQSSPVSVEVSSGVVISDNGIDNSSSPDLEVSQALRRLEEQLSLNDDSLEGIGPFYSLDENSDESGVPEYERDISQQEQQAANLHGPEYTAHDSGFSGLQDGSNNLVLLRDAGGNGERRHQSFLHEYTVDSKESVSWKEMLDSSKSSLGTGSHEKNPYTWNGNETTLSSSRRGPTEEKEYCRWLDFDGNNTENCSDFPTSDDVENFSAYSNVINTQQTNPGYYTTLFDQSQIGMPFEADSSLTIAEKQKFTIREISPEWGYSSDVTKVFIIGSFLCNPSESAWTCMFGDIEVPVQIIQEGVILCQAPTHPPGKVTLCITSGNRESCSEVREFEYCVKTSSCTHCNMPQTEVTSSPEELLLLVRFVQMLLSDPLMQKGDRVEPEIDVLRKLKADEDAWSHVIEALLVGSGTSSSTMDWLLQELLKDKLQQWLSCRSLEGCDQSGCLLSKKEQGIIHMVAGLGFEWALHPILSYGVSVNFRDISGWTALHWAARFGREKMVAALIASGASAGAVTDPNTQDPTGKTPAAIAATNGHKGLAGYLSELALTSHLSSLTLEESELSKGSAEVEAEITVNRIPEESLTVHEDHLSLKDTLAAVRNAAQAAARIQYAFRAHSFRKRQQIGATSSVGEYGISSDDVQRLSAVSRLAFRNVRDYNSAALSIQKKYRGWKGRKDFLALRQKVVKIQAHVRGHQVRKNYKVCWAVGVLEKVVLRWRRRGVGLRGFRPEAESIDESEDEDILKVFRKQKVDVAIDEAVSRVLSMVDSPNARQQYRRLLERYRQAKAELRSSTSEAAATSLRDVYNMENDDMFEFP